eukprot:scaffold218237_cov24-Attheya_sp.AAC.1
MRRHGKFSNQIEILPLILLLFNLLVFYPNLSLPPVCLFSDLSRCRVIGSDKSLGKDSELFGIPIQSKSLLQESLTPRNLSPAAQTALAEGTPDGVSQPGAYFVSDADDQASTLTLLVASLATQNTDNKRL